MKVDKGRKFKKFVPLMAVLFFSMNAWGCADVEEEPGEAEIVISEADLVSGNAVVATADRHGTEIGLEVLKNGGNAFDAAVAVGLAMGVVEPHASGIGGGGTAVYYDASEDKYGYLLFRGPSPMGVKLETYQENPDLARRGMTAAVVPGSVKAYQAILEKLGSMDFEELVQPSIKLAREGVPVSRTVAEQLVGNMAYILQDPETASILMPDGFPLAEGDIYINEPYADILETLAEEGPDSFYTGSVAEKIVAGMQSGGSYMTLDDFAQYDVTWGDTIKSSYRGYDIYSTDLPASGMTMIQILKVLENFDIPFMDPGGADRYHILAETVKQATADRLTHMADPRFFDSTSSYGVISDSYTRSIAEGIDMHQASTAQSPATVEELLDHLKQDSGSGQAHIDGQANTACTTPACFLTGDSGSTTNFIIVDEDGNAIVFTTSIGFFLGGKQMIPGTGILLNNQFTNYVLEPGHFTSLEPGKYVHIMHGQALIAEDGRLIAGVGTPGGHRIPSSISQVVANIIDYDMNLKEAIDFPLMMAMEADRLDLEGRVAENVVEELRGRGHNVNVRGERDLHFGGLSAFMINHQEGTVEAFADLRRDGASGVLVRE